MTISIKYKQLEPIQIAFLKAHLDDRDQIASLFDRLSETCGETICGEPLAIFHGGVFKEGFLLEAAYPVNQPIETAEIHTRLLEATPAFTMIHKGSHETIRETIQKIYNFMEDRPWTNTLNRREVYKVWNHAHPDKNVTEVQVLIHEWERLLAEGAEKEMGSEVRQVLMEGIEAITPASSSQEYLEWIQGAIERLDDLTSDEHQKCRVVSHCAHVFPQERIDHLRAIYEQSDIDAVLREMYDDPFWYEKPIRRGNVIYMRKNPYNPEGYEKATTAIERRKAYCHCPFVQTYLDEIPSKLSPTFCYCGAGWYRRLWEGILGQPVLIEHVETLLRGNDQCTLTMTLPFELTGECSPD